MKKKTLKTAKGLLTMLLAVVLLLSLTGCNPTNPNQKLYMNFPEVTTDQALAVRQTQQTPMLLTTAEWDHYTNHYIYDENDRLIRIDVSDGNRGVAYYTEYKYTERIGLGTEITEITYMIDGSLFNHQCRIITLNEQGQCVKVITTTVNAPTPSVDREPLTDVFEYDAQGRLIRYTDGDEEFQYIYNEYGYVIEEKQYFLSGTQRDAWYQTFYTRDAAGQPKFIKQDRYGERNTTNNRSYAIEYKGDENGRLLEINRYPKHSKEIYKQTKYNYDASGKLIGRAESSWVEFPVSGLEWLSLGNSWGGVKQLTWLTPEAYHAQVKE